MVQTFKKRYLWKLICENDGKREIICIIRLVRKYTSMKMKRRTNDLVIEI